MICTLNRWLSDTLHELKHGSLNPVLDRLRTLYQTALDRRLPQAEVIQESFDYLDKRRALITYTQCQAAGYPIGGGAVESGNKVVVETRLKGSGMHWAIPRVNPMPALRDIACNAR